jgi:acetylornithine deacetylase/succinyl-diaminopimelate desuccinylase-like protein
VCQAGGRRFGKTRLSGDRAPDGGCTHYQCGSPGESARTLLFYDHYDVQPAEPLDLWETPPFEPTLRDGKLFGRGVSDNKGDIANRLLAIDAILADQGELPCTVNFLIEGEEEVSSTNLEAFVDSHRQELAADACIWEFGSVDFQDVPVFNILDCAVSAMWNWRSKPLPWMCTPVW